MKTPEVHVGSIIIDEPITAGTDLILTILCLIIFTWLYRFREQCTSISPWRNFFLLMGVSTLFGSIVHGLRYYQSDFYHYNSWMAMNLISGVAVYFAQVATLRSNFRDSSFRHWLAVIPNVQLMAYFAMVLIFRSFNVVIIQVAAGMLPIMLINFFDYLRGTRGGAWITSGIAVACLSAVVHALQYSPHFWFNHNDLSHVLLMCSFTMISVGVAVRMGAAGQQQNKTSLAN